MTTPKSPITGTVFDTAAATKMLHITEFTADLMKHKKLNLDPSRNDHLRVTFHDSCNPARGMDCWKNRATSSRTCVTTTSRCPKAPLASRHSAVRAAPA